jgi:type IV secretory pathway VirB3-like protein
VIVIVDDLLVVGLTSSSTVVGVIVVVIVDDLLVVGLTSNSTVVGVVYDHDHDDTYYSRARC